MTRRKRAVDEIISNAIESGAFDNLKGKGEPLNLDNNPHADPEWRLAYDMLKQNNFAPEWIEARQEIESELSTALEKLSRTKAWREEALEGGEEPHVVDREWEKAKKIFREAVESINEKIDSYNLNIPSDRLYRKRVNVEREIEGN